MSLTFRRCPHLYDYRHYHQLHHLHWCLNHRLLPQRRRIYRRYLNLYLRSQAFHLHQYQAEGFPRNRLPYHPHQDLRTLRHSRQSYRLHWCLNHRLLPQLRQVYRRYQSQGLNN